MLRSGRMTVAAVAGIVIGFRPLNPRVVRPADSILNVATQQRIGNDGSFCYENEGVGMVRAQRHEKARIVSDKCLAVERPGLL